MDYTHEGLNAVDCLAESRTTPSVKTYILSVIINNGNETVFCLHTQRAKESSSVGTPVAPHVPCFASDGGHTSYCWVLVLRELLVQLRRRERASTTQRVVFPRHHGHVEARNAGAW